MTKTEIERYNRHNQAMQQLRDVVRTLTNIYHEGDAKGDRDIHDYTMQNGDVTAIFPSCVLEWNHATSEWCHKNPPMPVNVFSPCDIEEFQATDQTKLVELVAHRFAVALEDGSNHAQWQKMLRDNLERGVKGACASHDFCDANMAMESAFENLGLGSPNDESDHGNPTLFDIWNRAWVIAKRDYLTATSN